jgi:hypothetical protein
MEQHVSILFKTYINCFYLPIMKGHPAEPVVQCGEEMRDNENDLLIWAVQRPRNFHIEVVAEAYIQHSCSNCTSYG